MKHATPSSLQQITELLVALRSFLSELIGKDKLLKAVSDALAAIKFELTSM